MKRKSNNKGFTLAEMLMVVAIIVVLMGVSFVAVQNHQRSMTRLEYDGIAKEIFVAAQNHLTAAEGQGYLQLTDYGTPGGYGTDVSEKVYVASKDAQNAADILELMLPFAAVDETVRAGGTYLIRYQPSSGTVLDVFYSLPGRSSMLTVAGVELTSDDYETLMGSYTGEGNKARENYSHNGKSGVVGWYGGAATLPTGTRLKEPEIIIHNEEILWVEIQDTNNLSDGASLKLTVKGDVSGTPVAFDLSATNNSRVRRLASGNSAVILDDITTSGMHFWDLTDTNGNHFIPGENISVEAVAFNNTALTNIAYSGKKTTNSLFADIETTVNSGVSNYAVLVDNFRHFENQEKTISAFDNANAYKDQNGTAVTIDAARQIVDMNWTDTATGSNAFIQRVHTIKDSFSTYPNFSSSDDSNKLSIYNKDNSALVSTDDKLYRVSPDYALDYNGGRHKISNVKVSADNAAGLFGTLPENSKVENLELIDFEITGSTSAGALVGSAANTEITNVVAYNSPTNDAKFDNDDITSDKLPNVTATGAAGGLIGSMSGGKIEKSAAALYVNSTGTAAGGLIGSASSGTVTACYSGGHTYSGAPSYNGVAADAIPDDRNSQKAYPARYYDANNNPMYNVSATGTAGGLIGSAGSTTISGSYSTCSASGATAGGFVGTGGTISNSYCTGLVSGTNAEGAFSGSASTGSGADNTCKYFEIINERRKTDNAGNLVAGYTYLTAFSDGTDGNVGKIDGTAADYQTFSGDPNSGDPNSGDPKTGWAEAMPYDAGGKDTDTEKYGLKVYYKVKGTPHYNFPTVERLNESASAEQKIEIKADDFVAIHHGDWPAPEEFIFN